MRFLFQTLIMNISPSIEFHKNKILDFQKLIQKKGITQQTIQQAHNLIAEFYKNNRRPFIWRDKISDYGIFLSEIMLQQTQTQRVIIKYQEFLSQFPDFQTLAESSFFDVLKYWKGLGYNRRARYLHESAKIIHEKYNGKIPNSPDALVELPGIGPATSCSIATFVHNHPYIFIETNIRSVFIWLFYSENTNVSDKLLMPLIEQTLDTENPREWYYALMDFGVFIKKEFGNPNKKSKHYTKQSKFAGSNRQIRGMLLNDLLQYPKSSYENITERLALNPERIQKNLDDLVTEQLISYINNLYSIK